ncbi:MAG TPA: tetratricopeptide repeat protein [Victivallales bacterium]|nr:tetratricopeptide repeat protein [Victivallales bacterium]HRU01440.1 tetratricopeptide repeat protein [Victivallales bacterium]
MKFPFSSFLGLKALVAFIFFVAIFANSCSVKNEKNSQKFLKEAFDSLLGKNPDWKKAKLLAAKAVKAEPGNYRAILLLAAAYEKTGQTDAAIDELKRAVKIAPNYFLSQYTLGRLYFEKGQFDNALTHLINAHNLNSENSETLFYLARTYQKLKQNKNAHKTYIELCKKNNFKKRVEPYNELGTIYLMEKDLNNALKALIYAYRLDKENYKVIWNLAVLYDFYIKNPASAIAFYEQYQQITLINPELVSKREFARKRIAELSYRLKQK